jgi:hypothetical protein
MSGTDARQRLPLATGRGIVTVLAVLPLVLAGFVVGYGVGSGDGRFGDAVREAWEGGEGTVDHRPLAASFTATAVEGRAPDAPAVLPVGYSDDLGIAVAHLQFAVDESTVRPAHTAELRLPVAVPPDSEGMTVEVASVHPVSCLCSLTAATAPPYGTVWDAVEVNAATTEIVFDVTGAINAPGRYGFAVTSPDRKAYLELEGAEYNTGPALRTVSEPDAPTGPLPPTAPAELPPSPSPSPSDAPTDSPLPTGSPSPSGSPSPTGSPSPAVPPAGPADPAGSPSPTTDPSAVPGLPAAEPTEPLPESGQSEDQLSVCSTGDKLIPTCGALVGVAPAAHTSRVKEDELLAFEERVQHTQQIYHAYERGDDRLFPTDAQIALTEDPERPRTLFINWKPRMASWAEIAAGDPEVDAYLDRLAAHITANFDKPFFFTVHHEPENDVVQREGSGMEAADYAAMFRYVVERLRAAGVDNLVSVMNYMGYLKWVEKPWHDQLYPGDDVVDWIGLSGYGQSLHDDGRSDFGEIVDQTKGDTAWPGFYHWVAKEHPAKPMMLAEWGVFHEEQYPDHQAAVFQAARYQMAHYPRLKAIVYFETPSDSNGGRNSEIHLDDGALEAFRDLMRSPFFDVRLELRCRGRLRVPLVRGHEPIARDREAPRRVGRLRDAGPRARDRSRRSALEHCADHVAAVVRPVPAHRLRQPRRTPREVPVLDRLTAPPARERLALDDFPGAQQHRRARPVLAADQVRAEVHAVGEVHVQEPGGTEHHRRALRRPAEGMRGRIVLAVRLDLRQPHRHAVRGHDAAQQIRGHHHRIPGEERPVQHPRHRTALQETALTRTRTALPLRPGPCRR